MTANQGTSLDNDPTLCWRALLTQWQLAFKRRDAQAIAALFATDALFQGLSPTLLKGRDAIQDYYENVPPNVQAQIANMTSMALTSDTASGFADVTFSNIAGQASKPVRLSITAQRCDEQWLIKTYHVSPLL